VRIATIKFVWTSLILFIQVLLSLKEEMLYLQHFHNKSYIVSYYWFEHIIEITFLLQQ